MIALDRDGNETVALSRELVGTYRGDITIDGEVIVGLLKGARKSMSKQWGSEAMADGSGPFELRHDAWGRLVLTLGGEDHIGVEVSRAFPITAPRLMVSVCSAEGRELLWIEDLDALPSAARGELEEALSRRDFVPVLRRILRVSAVVEPSEWEVETDRGVTKFLLNSDEDVYPLTGGRALITDSHGVRYLIEDLAALDPHSRRLLERYL